LLYNEAPMMFEEGDTDNQKHVAGFIKLNALRLRLGARLKK